MKISKSNQISTHTKKRIGISKVDRLTITKTYLSESEDFSLNISNCRNGTYSVKTKIHWHEKNIFDRCTTIMIKKRLNIPLSHILPSIRKLSLK